MYFTLLFDRQPEGPVLSYDLVFHPCPVWIQGDEHIGVPNPKDPWYAMGHLGYLLNEADFKVDDLNSPRVGIVCHEGGHGREEDLNLLLADLKSEGFEPQILFHN
jgi:hypothetical protein